ncbi:MAG: hypothetical protein MPN21_18850 [Thermoanaerobaculia bacterium]|nr:hypothetical protein [Thermoanaerobaculia bacterium]
MGDSPGIKLCRKLLKFGDNLKDGDPCLNSQQVRNPLGLVPLQMTYDGDNFDIASGILALVVGALLFTGVVGRRVALAFNWIGLALLVRVVSIAILSSPVPFRTYGHEPVLQVAFFVPTTWILAICVAAALLGHLLLFRRLRMSPRE